MDEERQHENEACLEAYFNGLRNGIRRYAWWKDGEQNVGTCGTSFKQAMLEVDKEKAQDRVLLQKYLNS